jgi:hypothetical protein
VMAAFPMSSVVCCSPSPAFGVASSR